MHMQAQNFCTHDVHFNVREHTYVKRCTPPTNPHQSHSYVNGGGQSVSGGGGGTGMASTMPTTSRGATAPSGDGFHHSRAPSPEPLFGGCRGHTRAPQVMHVIAHHTDSHPQHFISLCLRSLHSNHDREANIIRPAPLPTPRTRVCVCAYFSYQRVHVQMYSNTAFLSLFLSLSPTPTKALAH